MALTLCACANQNSLQGTPPITVSLPTACERLLVKAPVPAVQPTDDARVAFFKDDAALLQANGTIGRGRQCLVRQRQLYSAGGKS